MDVGPFFKTMKSLSRKTTTLGSDNPLRKLVEDKMTSLSQIEDVKLPTSKLRAVIDCISSTPEILAKRSRMMARSIFWGLMPRYLDSNVLVKKME